MNNSNETKRGWGWRRTAILLFGLLVLYVLSSGPMFLVFARRIPIGPAGVPGPAASPSPQFAYELGAYETIYAPVLALAQHWEPMGRYVAMFAEAAPAEETDAPVHSAHPAAGTAGPL